MVKPRTFPVVILAALAAALAGCNADPMRNPHAAAIWGPLECQRQGHWRPDWWKNPIAPRRYRWFDSGGPDNRPYRRLTVFDRNNRTVGERCQLGFDDWGHHWGTKGSFQVYREGEHRITAFWLRFRRNFPLHTRAWQIVSEMGQAEPSLSAGGPPVLALDAYRNRLHLLHYGGRTNQLWRSPPVKKGAWIQIFENVVYSRHSHQGSVKVAVDLNGDGDRSDPGEHSHRIATSTLKQETQPGGPIPRGDSIPSVLRIGTYHAKAIHCPEGCSLDVGDVWVISAKSTPNPDPGPGPIPCGGRNYGPVSGPNPCRRPYSASSPWNTPVPGGTPAQSNSDQIVQRLMGFADNPSNLDVSASGPSAEDYMTPIFTAKDDDPELKIQETMFKGPLNGTYVHVPTYTQVSGNFGYDKAYNDSHLVIVQPDGTEVDFWGVQKIDFQNKVITVASSGSGPADGSGLNIPSVDAAHFGKRAGLITGEELQAGEIDHALVIGVGCVNGKYVWPATPPASGAVCSDTANAPAMGQHFQLTLTDAQIDALAVPAWQKVIMKAMHEYGMYVRDTGRGWGLFWPNHLTYQQVGKPDPLIEYAKAHLGQGIEPWTAGDGTTQYVYKFSRIDWGANLRVLSK